MEFPNRRQALKSTLATGGALGLTAGSLAAQEATQEPKSEDDEITADEKFVMEAGMTREEAECWKLTAQAAGSFFKLPRLHPTDATEVAQAIHIIQNKLLGRPTYRKYLAKAKAAHQEKK